MANFAVTPGDIGTIPTSGGILYAPGELLSANGTIAGCEWFAIHLQDESTLWQQNISCEAIARFTSFAYADGMLYATGVDGAFTAFSSTDGTIRWMHPAVITSGLLGGNVGDTFVIGAVGPGVLFVDSTHFSKTSCIVGCDPNVGTYRNALNPMTGTICWRDDSELWSSYQLDSAT